MSKIRRGEIWLANLDPRHRTEPGKTGPVLVVQSQTLLDAEYSSSLIIPSTTRLIEDAEPLRVRVRATGWLRRDSDLLIGQLRAIHNRRLTGSPLARLSEQLMAKTGDAIREVFGLL